MFKEKDKIKYQELNAKQKETYNFQKFSAVFADYGFATIKLNDDWNGADFIAQHINSETYLKIQLKGRLTFEKKYLGKKIHICFRDNNNYYLYDHDELLEIFLKEYEDDMAQSNSWLISGAYSFPYLNQKRKMLLKQYLLI
jgi:hypothetical protein